MRATRSGQVPSESRPGLVVSLGLKRRTDEVGNEIDVGSDGAPHPQKKPRKAPEPLFDPNDDSTEGRHQRRFHALRSQQLQRLREVREEQRLTGQWESSRNADDRFALLMQCVQAFTTSGAKAGAKAKGLRRGGGGGAEDDCEVDEASVGYLTRTPPYLKGELRPYQIEGVNWLIGLFDAGLNGILADEMGLGKTFQTIALLSYLKKTRGIGGPHLVVCPLSVLMNWCREVQRWCPDMTVLRFHGDGPTRDVLRRTELIPGKYDIVVTTYEMANMERTALQKFRWKHIIVDEAHRLKNEDSLLSQTLRLFRSNHRILVTGTPLQNNLHELWALLNFLLPDLFNDAEEFDSWYNVQEGKSEEGVINQIHRLLRPFMLRRLKSEVNTDIPPKKEVYVGCGMTKLQREWYTNALAKEAVVVNLGTGTKSRLLNVVMQLRKVCNHPYLFPGAEEGPPFVTDETIVNASGKMRVLDKLLPRLYAQGHRVLLFSQMTRMMDILEDYMQWRGYKYLRLDGSTSPLERDERMQLFNAPASPYFLFMLSTRAGGLGINLATADTVILYDSDWNPQVDLQAQDRAHRIGQTKPVTVLRFIADGTVDERIYQRALKKLYLDAAVIQQGRLQNQNAAASKDELLSMIRFGAEQMFKSRDEEITDEDIEILLNRGEQKVHSLTSKMESDCQMTLANFSIGIEDSNLYEFEGVNYTVQPSRQLYLRNIDASVAEEDLRSAFMDCGEMRRIVISPERDTALVEFYALASATRAYNEIRRLPTIGQCTSVEAVYGTKANLGIVGIQEIQDSLSVKSKRACKVEYNEGVLASKSIIPQNAEAKGPKLPRKPVYYPHQFFDLERLEQLWEEECKFILAEHHRRLEKATARRLKEQQELMQSRRRKEKDDAPDGQPTDAYPDVKEDELEEDDDEGGKDGATGSRTVDRALTSAEQREKEDILRAGFSDWQKADYFRFVKATVEFGRADVESIAKAMPDKDPAEVRRYAEAFWTHGPRTLGETEWNRVTKKIAKAQAERDTIGSRITKLKWKAASVEDPVLLNFPHRTAGCTWDDEEDRQLLLATVDLGYGNWDAVRRRLTEVPALAFDWLIKSRTSGDIRMRTDALIRMVEREQSGPEPKAKTAAGRTRGKQKQEGAEEPASPGSPTGYEAE